MRGFAEFVFDKKSLKEFEATCNFTIRNVGRGTKKATIEATQEIMKNSVEQVPKLTFALLSSAYWEVYRRTDTASTTWAYESEMGYGGNGDPVNPNTHKRVSSYAVVVHEDLSLKHPIGKAKFLEDPVEEYGKTKFKRVVFKYMRDSLSNFGK